jgi:Subtilase family
MSPRFLPVRLGLAASAVFALPLAAQILTPSQEEAAPGMPLPRVPATSVDGLLNSPVAEPNPALEAIDRGAPEIRPFTPSDDSLPLPNPARYAPGAEGDVLLEAASGDPFFLGFIAGQHKPPAGERVDAALAQRLIEPAIDGRPKAESYAYVMLQKRASPARQEELEALGARVLSFRPHQAFAVALDIATLERLQTLDSVRWIGAAPAMLKLHPELFRVLADKAAAERVEVIVSLFEGDESPETEIQRLAPAELAGPDLRLTDTQSQGARVLSRGWQHKALEAVGAEVLEYLPNIRAQRLRVTPAQAFQLANLDFVEFVEPELRSKLAHDDSQPMIGSDVMRATYDGSFSGEAIAGLIDSGTDTAHTGLNHAYYLGWTLTGESTWFDSCGHGSHVTGSILALPASPLDELRGAAPGLGFDPNRSFRTVKIFEFDEDENECGGPSISMESRFSLMRDTWTSGQISSPKPHVINNSWGTGPESNGVGWTGTEANSRSVDAEVWNENQVYVFAAHNFGPDSNSLSQEGSAKNAIVVGNVVPYNSGTVGLPGNLWTSSSRGPTADGRWKPNVTAPGRQIVSVNAETGSGYSAGTGTSMAAPHVTGVVAQMVDHYSFLRYAPARVGSVLMATASPKNGAAITSPNDAILDQHGAGRVDAQRAANTDGQHGWQNWGYTLSANQEASADFTVPEGVERLVVAMHYTEAAASAGASQALVNDFDLVVDRAPFAAAIDQGDFVAQQSTVNNTELRHFDNPQAGDWRWKVYPDSATSSVRLSITVHYIYADPTPNPTLSLSADDIFVQPGEAVQITATVDNSAHIASAVHLDTTNASSADLLASTFVLGDGAVADLTDNPANNGGFDVTLGNVRYNLDRSAQWSASWDTSGQKTWAVTGTSDNGMNRNTSVVITVDGTNPGLVQNLQSSSHFPGQWYKQNDVQLVWDAAFDALSGVAGYGIYVHTAASLPSTDMDLGPVTLDSTGPLTTNANGWYYNIRTVDKSGNWSASFASVGPFLIDTVAPGTVSGLVSTSHLTNVWSNDPTIDLQWVAANDSHSGLGGYGWSFTSNTTALPGATQDLGLVTSVTLPLTTSASPRFFNLRAVDAVDNWSPNFGSAGPFLIDTLAPTINNFFVGNELGGAGQTADTQVTLYLQGTDAHSGLGQMRFQNDGGSWSNWMPYVGQALWDLTSFGGSTSTGTRTIRAELRDVAGNVSSAGTQVFYYQPTWVFGNPGLGALGKPTINIDGIPTVGQAFDVTVSNTNAPLKRLVLGTSNSTYLGLPLPLDLTFLASPDNSLLVSMDLTLQEGLSTQATINVPNNKNFAGQTFYLQWLMFGDASGRPIVTSNAAGLVINGQ